jgi:histidine phosphotransferase ChpT
MRVITTFDTMLKDATFSELMCSRFCHDISGAVGAISNSVDFLDSKNEDIKRKAVDLVKFSSNQAINKVIFFRKAYGLGSSRLEMSLTDLKSLIEGFCYGTKIELDFRNFTSDLIEGNIAKLILNAAVIISGVVMQRGRVTYNFDAITKSVTINAISDGYGVGDELLEILSGKANTLEMNTRNIQFFYTHEVAKSTNYDIDISASDGAVTMVLASKK